MNQDPFPGYPSYLAEACRRLERPEAEAPARRIATLAALANLCAQASQAPPADAAAILAKASEFRDQLHAAALAADLILEEVSGRATAADRPPPAPPSAGREDASTARRGPRGGRPDDAREATQPEPTAGD